MPSTEPAVLCPCKSGRPLCKSLSREKTTLLTRATEERAKTNTFRTHSSQHVPLGVGSYLRRTGHLCKSLSREKTTLLTRATEERAKTNTFRTHSSQHVPLGVGSYLRRTGHLFAVSDPVES